MKNVIVLFTCFTVALGGIQFPLFASNHSSNFQVRTLSPEENQARLRNNAHWLEIKSPSPEYKTEYKILDGKGNVTHSGLLKNGLAYINLGELHQGKYTLELKYDNELINKTIEVL